MSNTSLPVLYKRCLETASKLCNLPTISEETQELVQSALEGLREVHARIRELVLFSSNESLDDISTRDLVYLTLPYVFAEVENRVQTTERMDRMSVLSSTIEYHRAFVHQLEHYEIVQENEKDLYSHKSSSFANLAKRREVKVNQYKKTKKIKDHIQVLQKRYNLPTSSSEDAYSQSDFDLIYSLLSSPPSTLTSTTIVSSDELDTETDEILRTTTLLLLRMFYGQAHAHLESMEQELELLKQAPPGSSSASPSLGERGDLRIGKGKGRSDEQLWKIDLNVPDRNGPLLDQYGRPLRPFMILPSNMAERAKLRAQVFGAGYSLPTMSIDEYLTTEKGRGNIITGGGKASLEKPTSSKQLQIDSEMDGTVAGEEKAEEKRQKDEKWSRFTDANPRGAGNTMNRG
ncbi:Type 2A phosphatase-associated protein 42 [Leucoagaricus gongylophorus]